MTALDRLLDAVLADPDDDAPRLVYADALLAVGDPRGELIVTQCARARLDDGDPARPPLRARELALLAAHRGAWVPAGITARFERGFVEHVAADAATLAGHAAWLAREPVTGVRLDPGRDELAALLDTGALDRVRRLELNASAETLATLLGSPLARRLEALSLWLRHADVDGRDLALAEVPGLDNLRALRLSRLALEDYEVARFLETLPALDDLWLDEHLGPLAADSLLDRSRLGGLRRLTIASCDDAAAAALALGVPGLEALWLIATGEVRLEPIARGGLRGLRELGFGGHYAAAGVDAVGDAGWPLRALTIWSVRPGLGRALAIGDAFRGLRRLSISDLNVEGDELADVMDGRWPHLHTLAFHVDGIHESVARAIAAAHAPALTTIETGTTWMSPESRAILAERVGVGLVR